jgi:hypothetical protein
MGITILRFYSQFQNKKNIKKNSSKSKKLKLSSILSAYQNSSNEELEQVTIGPDPSS